MSTNSRVCFVLPRSIQKEFKKQQLGSVDFVTFPDPWFDSVRAYNSLLLNRLFWVEFSAFDQIVICQTDAVLIKRISSFPTSDYDYIGAVWGTRRCRLSKGRISINSRSNYLFPHRKLVIGNGGLSVRRVKVCLEILNVVEGLPDGSLLQSGINPEDIVFAYFLKKLKYSVPAAKVANTVFMEDAAIGLSEIPDVYGFHDLPSKNLSLETKLFDYFKSGKYIKLC